MPSTVWPLFDLRLRTPTIELRYVDDELARDLARLAAEGIHDSDDMPFATPWTDVPSPLLERSVMQWFWRCRAETTPDMFYLCFAAIVDGTVVGTSSLGAMDFGVLGQFETGSWLGRAHQGRGIGTEMRRATLSLGFAGLGATLAQTGAFDDNVRSLGVTRRLGYTEVGGERRVRRGAPMHMRRFEMTREFWEANVRHDDIEIHGLTRALPLLGLDV